MSSKIHRSNNRGLIYNGFLIPSFDIKFQKGKGNKVGDYVITKPSLKSSLKGINTTIISRIYNSTPFITNQAQLDVAIKESLTKLVSAKVKEENLRQQILDEMLKEYKKDRDDQAEALAYSSQNRLNGTAANKIIAYNSEVKSAVEARGQKEEAIQKVQGEAKEALEKQRVKARKALRGEAKKQKDLAEAAQKQRLIDAIEQAKIEANRPGSRLAGFDPTVIGEIAKKYIQQGKTAKQFNDNIEEDLRKTQGEIDLKGARASRLEAARVARQQPIPAAAPAAGGDSEYEAPDSQAAQAPVAPAAANLNPGAGSQAPIRQAAGNVIGSAMGRAFRRRQRNQQLRQQAAARAAFIAGQPQAIVDAEEAEQLRAAGMRNVAEGVPPPPQEVVPNVETFEGVTPPERTQQIGLEIREKEKEDVGTRTDDNLDVSKYGYDKQVSIFAIQENRDFTYTKEQVKKTTPNIQEGLMDALKMWGYTIEIKKPKTNDYEEACEIRTFIFLAKEKYALERQWKKALVQLPSALEDIGMSSSTTAAAAGGTNTSMGIITQFADPQVISNIVQQAAQGAAAGRAAARAARRGARPPPPGGVSRATSMTGFPPRPNVPPPASVLGTVGSGDVVDLEGGGGESKGGDDDIAEYSTERSDDSFGSADSGTDDGEFRRRRLTGMSRNVTFSSRPDPVIYRAGQRQAEALQNAESRAAIGRNERIPGGGQGVQRVRVPRASQPRPQSKGRRLDTRPKMNVKEAQFKMRKSRINPNLLFTNLTKQNPNPVGQDSIFKTRTKTKTMRRIQF